MSCTTPSCVTIANVMHELCPICMISLRTCSSSLPVVLDGPGGGGGSVPVVSKQSIVRE